MARAPRADSQQELLQFLATVCGSRPQLLNRESWGQQIGVARCADYPHPGLTTIVTLDASRLRLSLYRGRDVGFELTLTMAKEDPALVETLVAAVRENLRLGTARARRPFIEFNGIYAPGCPPHLLFTEQVTCTPELAGRKRVGNRYIRFQAAIPLDDRELREYDRDVRSLIDMLRSSGRIAEYPRPCACG